MKHKKLFFIVLIILCAWLAVFVTDMISVSAKAAPVFALCLEGGEVREYIGLGYGVDVYYPFSDSARDAGPHVSVNFVPYIVVNVLAIGFLAALRITDGARKTRNGITQTGGV